jgi:hypothetical protein
MEIGAPGVDDNPENPLHRATARLFEDGKPFSRLALSFIRDELDALRWFGAFVEGSSGRIVFFPGFANQFDGLQAFRGESSPITKAFAFDHLTLEADKSKWHVTAASSSQHLGSPRTLDLGEGRFLWFGLSFASFSAFQLAKENTTVTFSSPSTDVERRRSILHEARENAKFPIFSLNRDTPNPFSPSFWHIGVIVGPKDFPTYLGGELGFPVGSPYLTEPLPAALSGVPTRTHRIELSANTDLQVTLCPLPGSLRVPLTFTGPQQPTTVSAIT